MEQILADLPTFVLLAQTGSVSRAAQQLGVPRSTISRRLKRLEEKMGMPLIERTTRSLRLTESGQLLAKESASLLAQFKTLVEKVKETSGTLQGVLRFSSPPGLSRPFLGHFLGLLQKKIPGLRVEYVVREDFPDLLDEGFDLALAMGPLPDSPWVRHQLGISRYLAVASPTYFEQKEQPKTLDDLAEHALLSFRSGDLKADAWPLQKGGVLPILPHMQSNDLGSILDAALHGVGIALLPMHSMLEELVTGKLIQVLSQDLGRIIYIYALSAPQRQKSPLLRAILDYIDQFGREVEALTPSSLQVMRPTTKRPLQKKT